MNTKFVTMFINNATEVHGDNYSYRKVEFKENSKTVTVICPRHGEFDITPRAHLLGVGCPECVKKDIKYTRPVQVKTKVGLPRSASFVEKSIQVFGKGTFNYSKTQYTHNTAKVTITCPKHGDFEVVAYYHYSRKIGCPTCDVERVNEIESTTGFTARGTPATLHTFITLANETHGEGTYDYSEVYFEKIRDKVTIICPEHGRFVQSAYGHYRSGTKCPKCARRDGAAKKSSTTEVFIQKAKEVHGEGAFDYSKVEYVAANKRVIIICPKHGEFKQAPRGHLSGRGCSECNNEETSRRMREMRRRLNGNRTVL